MQSTPDDILPTYGREARAWAEHRQEMPFERALWHDCVAGRAGALRVLDIGCGAGRPIAAWFDAQGHAVTGVDGAAPMLDIFRENVPGARAVLADMRCLALGERFDILLAFNSFFHLSMPAQRAMFLIFAAHAAPEARLMFTTGPSESEGWGRVGRDAPVYHSSLDPTEYRSLLEANGFEVVISALDDPTRNRHSVWLARFTGA